MKATLMLNSVPHIILSEYDERNANKRYRFAHPFGMALLSPCKRLGFVQWQNKWLMFKIEDYEA